jgi:hypothetical protein
MFSQNKYLELLNMFSQSKYLELSKFSMPELGTE